MSEFHATDMQQAGLTGSVMNEGGSSPAQLAL